jgi:ABC-type transport system involved in multi-copper enzyme maturation permease subunit
MSAFRVLYRREIRAWLSGPANYLMGAAFLALTGLGFWVLAVTLPGKGLLTSEITFGGLLFWMAVVATTSSCSVRLLGEERESGTLELLMTVPLREADIVLAKFSAGVSWMMMLCLPAVCYPWLLRLVAPGWHGVDAGAWAAGVCIVLLVVCMLTATGMLISQLLRRQMAAGAATFVVGSLLVFRGSLRNWIGEGGTDGIGSLVAMSSHVAGFAAGVVDSRSVIFYVSVVAVLLFLNVRLIQAVRFGRVAGVMNMAVSFVLAALLVVLVNYISLRHGMQANWSVSDAGGMTEQSRKVLAGLKAPAEVTLLASSGERVVPSVVRILDQYRQASPLLKVRVVDPDTDLSGTRDLVSRFRLRETGVLVVECGRRWKVLPLAAFASKGGGAIRPGQRGGVFLSNLERGLASTLYTLAQEAPPVVYFLSGHGERRLDDFNDRTGYSEIAGEIRDSVAEVRPLTIESGSGISNDCSVLVVAGPAQKLSSWEVGKIREYLARSGRVMFLLDSAGEVGVESLLQDWGVKLGHDRVVDPRRGSVWPLDRMMSTASGLGEVPVTQYGRHPVVAGLAGLVTVFTSPRSVTPLVQASPQGSLADEVDRPRVDVLAMTDGRSWAESDVAQDPPQFNEGYDRAGPIEVALCVERGVRSAIKMDIRPVRLVVFGDSQFVANRGLVGGNRRVFMNALDWLLEREPSVAAVGEERGLYDLRLPARRQWLAFALIVAAIPCLMLLHAAVVAVVRRDRRVPGAPLRKEGREA